MKDRDGNVLTSEENNLRRWKDGRNFEELMNEENDIERRMEKVETGTGSWGDE